MKQLGKIRPPNVVWFGHMLIASLNGVNLDDVI